MGVGDCDVVISLFLWVMLFSLLSYVLGCLRIVSMFPVAFILDLDALPFGYLDLSMILVLSFQVTP
jgi:hypothetical protein